MKKLILKLTVIAVVLVAVVVILVAVVMVLVAVVVVLVAAVVVLVAAVVVLVAVVVVLVAVVVVHSMMILVTKAQELELELDDFDFVVVLEEVSLLHLVFVVVQKIFVPSAAQTAAVQAVVVLVVQFGQGLVVVVVDMVEDGFVTLLVVHVVHAWTVVHAWNFLMVWPLVIPPRVAVDGVVDLELGYTILHRLSWQIDHPLIEVHIRLDPFEKCKINSQITTSFRFTFGFFMKE